MYQRILVPLDGSKTADRALQEAIDLTGGDAQFRLVSVLEEPYLDTDAYAFVDFAALQKALRHTGEQVLAHAAKKVRQSGAQVEIALLEAGGERIANVIGDDAKAWKADVIVIGTHGRSGINRLLMGSVAEGVVRVASVPVLLVRSE